MKGHLLVVFDSQVPRKAPKMMPTRWSDNLNTIQLIYQTVVNNTKARAMRKLQIRQQSLMINSIQFDL